MITDANSSDLNLLSGLRAMLKSYHKLQPKPKTDPDFKNALWLIWSAFYWRNQLITIWKTTASDCEHMCQPTVDILHI